jgi:aminoglycoside phosphotransferase (APT) family kinase protein
VIYEKLVAMHARGIAPRLFAVQHRPEYLLLYLEWIPRISSWPWRNSKAAEELVGSLARLHGSTADGSAAAAPPPWDYDAELTRSGQAALELLARCRRHDEFSALARHLPSLRRLAGALPKLRRQLFAFPLLGTAIIHGDVHPGNVLVRRRGGRDEAVLIDWGRARLGSPLEDLSAWLQSLGYWETQARRRHDTLFMTYLAARGMERRIGPDLRAAYWLAGASNTLSGALEHHLSTIFDPRAGAARKRGAAGAARHWLRIVHRADAVWK